MQDPAVDCRYPRPYRGDIYCSQAYSDASFLWATVGTCFSRAQPARSWRIVRHIRGKSRNQTCNTNLDLPVFFYAYWTLLFLGLRICHHWCTPSHRVVTPTITKMTIVFVLDRLVLWNRIIGDRIRCRRSFYGRDCLRLWIGLEALI